jgi:hypothetical protein
LCKLFPLWALYQIIETLADWKNIIEKILAFCGILINLPNILRIRKNIQKNRKLKDKEILKLMSYKLKSSSTMKNSLAQLVLKSINKLFSSYVKIVNIETLETSKSGKEQLQVKTFI